MLVPPLRAGLVGLAFSHKTPGATIATSWHMG